jgi:hypothetical protein
MNSCIQMLAYVIHIKYQQIAYIVWLGIFVKVIQNGRTGTYMLFKFLIFALVGWVYKCRNKILLAHCGLVLFSWCVVIVFIPGFCKFCLLRFLCWNSIDGACFNIWCNILISYNVFIMCTCLSSAQLGRHSLHLCFAFEDLASSCLWPFLIEGESWGAEYWNFHVFSQTCTVVSCSDITVRCKTYFSVSVVWRHLKYLIMWRFMTWRTQHDVYV